MLKGKRIFIAAAVSLAIMFGACSSPSGGITQVTMPAASPAAGNYSSAQPVTLTSETSGAEIYYTMDGSTPTTGSFLYSGPITISTTTTLKAIAVKEDMTNSEVMTAVYTIALPGQVVKPVPSPVEGNYSTAQSVTLTSETSGAEIYYTTDGSIPTTSSLLYSNPITISAITTLKAIAVKDDMTDSEVMTAVYTIPFVAATVEEIEPYLSVQTGGTTIAAPVPLKVTMALGDLSKTEGTNWRGLLDALASADKYVTLDISESTITGTSFNHSNLSPASGMEKILNIVLPDGITSIGDHAFLVCENLEFIDLPDGITSIGNSAFHGCINLRLTALPSEITSIGHIAFATCYRLALTSLPSEITYIGFNAFYGCYNLALTSLPAGITSIESRAFSGCTKLALTALPAGITSIEDDAFRGCTKLALTALPDGIDFIGNNAFQNCTSLALTSLPSGITSIGDYAFASCTNLATITIEAPTPPTLGSLAFDGILAVRKIRIEVPAVSVADYKAAAGWSDYKDYIFPIGG